MSFRRVGRGRSGVRKVDKWKIRAVNALALPVGFTFHPRRERSQPFVTLGRSGTRRARLSFDDRCRRSEGDQRDGGSQRSGGSRRSGESRVTWGDPAGSRRSGGYERARRGWSRLSKCRRRVGIGGRSPGGSSDCGRIPRPFVRPCLEGILRIALQGARKNSLRWFGLFGGFRMVGLLWFRRIGSGCGGRVDIVVVGDMNAAFDELAASPCRHETRKAGLNLPCLWVPSIEQGFVPAGGCFRALELVMATKSQLMYSNGPEKRE